MTIVGLVPLVRHDAPVVFADVEVRIALDLRVDRRQVQAVGHG